MFQGTADTVLENHWNTKMELSELKSGNYQATDAEINAEDSVLVFIFINQRFLIIYYLTVVQIYWQRIQYRMISEIEMITTQQT